MTEAAKKSKSKKVKGPAIHPKYNVMIGAAITSLKERNGSSRQAITKYLLATYKFSVPDQVPIVLREQIKRLVTIGELKQTKGTGASGRFKLAAKVTAGKPKKAKKGATPAKKAAKKMTPKKAAPKKKTPKKKTPAKKPKATPKKKSPAKKAAKKAPAKKAKK